MVTRSRFLLESSPSAGRLGAPKIVRHSQRARVVVALFLRFNPIPEEVVALTLRTTILSAGAVRNQLYGGCCHKSPQHTTCTTIEVGENLRLPVCSSHTPDIPSDLRGTL